MVQNGRRHVIFDIFNLLKRPGRVIMSIIASPVVISIQCYSLIARAHSDLTISSPYLERFPKLKGLIIGAFRILFIILAVTFFVALLSLPLGLAVLGIVLPILESMGFVSILITVSIIIGVASAIPCATPIGVVLAIVLMEILTLTINIGLKLFSKTTPLSISQSLRYQMVPKKKEFEKELQDMFKKSPSNNAEFSKSELTLINGFEEEKISGNVDKMLDGQIDLTRQCILQAHSAFFDPITSEIIKKPVLFVGNISEILFNDLDSIFKQIKGFISIDNQNKSFFRTSFTQQEMNLDDIKLAPSEYVKILELYKKDYLNFIKKLNNLNCENEKSKIKLWKSNWSQVNEMIELIAKRYFRVVQTYVKNYKSANLGPSERAILKELIKLGLKIPSEFLNSKKELIRIPFLSCSNQKKPDDFHMISHRFLKLILEKIPADRFMAANGINSKIEKTAWLKSITSIKSPEDNYLKQFEFFICQLKFVIGNVKNKNVKEFRKLVSTFNDELPVIMAERKKRLENDKIKKLLELAGEIKKIAKKNNNLSQCLKNIKVFKILRSDEKQPVVPELQLNGIALSSRDKNIELLRCYLIDVKKLCGDLADTIKQLNDAISKEKFIFEDEPSIIFKNSDAQLENDINRKIRGKVDKLNGKWKVVTSSLNLVSDTFEKLSRFGDFKGTITEGQWKRFTNKITYLYKATGSKIMDPTSKWHTWHAYSSENIKKLKEATTNKIKKLYEKVFESRDGFAPETKQMRELLLSKVESLVSQHDNNEAQDGVKKSTIEKVKENFLLKFDQKESNDGTKSSVVKKHGGVNSKIEIIHGEPKQKLENYKDKKGGKIYSYVYLSKINMFCGAVNEELRPKLRLIRCIEAANELALKPNPSEHDYKDFIQEYGQTINNNIH